MTLPVKVLPDNEVARDVLSTEMANLTLKGHGISQISRETGWTRKQVRKLMARPAFENYLREVEGHAKLVAKAYIRKSVQGMSPKIVAALERLLDKDNAKGVELALKVVSALEPDDPNAAAGNRPIMVMMPGSSVKQETIVDVTKETKSGD